MMWYNQLAVWKHNHDNRTNFRIEHTTKGWLYMFNTGITFYYDMPVFNLRLLEYYFAKYVPCKEDVVFDVGSEAGLFGLYAAKLVGCNGRVYCFEKNQEVVLRLKKNIERNNLKNVFIKDGCVSNQNGDNGSEKLIRLDTDQGVKRVDMVKMDIEGRELVVLDSHKSFFRQYKPAVSVAAYHIVDGMPTKERVCKILEDVGYKPFVYEKDHLTVCTTKL